MKTLSKTELNELKGGIENGDTSGSTNHNTVLGCNCNYNDCCETKNLNTVTGCTCTCVNPSNQ
jgi:hypothetical protein